MNSEVKAFYEAVMDGIEQVIAPHVEADDGGANPFLNGVAVAIAVLEKEYAKAESESEAGK